MSSPGDNDPIYLAELFAGFGPVDVRRMFGGAGIFAGGVMIGLVSQGVIHLKADETTIPDFEREGLGPVTYAAKTGNRSVMSYWRMPERLYDDPEELARWARLAHAVALNSRDATLRPAKPRRRAAKRPKAPAVKARKKK